MRRATCRACSSVETRIYFYPRSPCGERRAALVLVFERREFLSTLSLRRATRRARRRCGSRDISIHALLAESDCRAEISENQYMHFYPRSPCGERPEYPLRVVMYETISIHALLAESDYRYSIQLCQKICVISIHALLAESDIKSEVSKTYATTISIHALLAESDSKSAQNSGVLLRI